MAKKDPNVKIMGDKRLEATFKRIYKRAPEAATVALNDCVLDLAGESARRAPVETGDLRNNCVGVVNGQTVFARQETQPSALVPVQKPEGSVGYSLPYALRQHEDLSMRHDRTDGYTYIDKDGHSRSVNLVAGGEAKYLENPFNERVETYIKHFAKKEKELLK